MLVKATDYSHPIKSKRRELKIAIEQLEVILEEGISASARKLKLDFWWDYLAVMFLNSMVHR